jgi:hypothetical protein
MRLSIPTFQVVNLPLTILGSSGVSRLNLVSRFRLLQDRGPSAKEHFMKRTIGTFTFLFFLAFTLVAHNHSLPLAKGRAIVGWNWSIFSSALQDFAFTETNGSVSSAQVNVGTPSFGPSWAGDALSVEYAVTDGLTLGIKANVLQSLTQGLRDGDWGLQGSIFSSIDLGAEGMPWHLGLDTELQISPVFPPKHKTGTGDGLVNVFSTLDLSYSIVKLPGLILSPYLDFKAIACLPHPILSYRMTPSYYQSLMTAMRLPTASDFSVTLVPTLKFATAIGVDIELFERAIAYFGLNTELATLMSDTSGHILFRRADFSARQLLAVMNWEGEVKFRL